MNIFTLLYMNIICSFFGQLAENFVVHDDDESDTPEDKCTKNFPDLLWLLRNNDFICEDSNGRVTSVTEYIKMKVLQPTGQSSTTNAVSRALLTLFPSLECMQICSPMVHNPTDVAVDHLPTEFNDAIENSVKYILTMINPRKGINKYVKLDGVLIAELANQYTKALNVPNSVPNLEHSYQLAVKYKMNELSERLIKCYKEEMTKLLSKNKYPMEEGNLEATQDTGSSAPVTLFGIHNRVFQPKWKELKVKVKLHMGNSVFVNDRESILNNFWDRIRKTADNKLCEGILYVYVTENHHQSHIFCNNIFDKVYEAQSEVNLDKIKTVYNEQAIGPAKASVLQEKLSAIPLAPKCFNVVKTTHNSVTVTWSSDSQDSYTFELDIKNFKAPIVFPKGSKLLPQIVTDLSPNKEYTLRIRACNSHIKGEYSEAVRVKTLIGIPSKPDKPRVILDSDCPSKATVKIYPLSTEKLKGALVIDKVIVEESYGTIKWIESSFESEKKLGCKPIDVEVELPSIPAKCKSIYYRVCVVTKGGRSEASDLKEVLVADLIPGPPTNLVVRSSDSEKEQAAVSWNIPEINNQSVAQYHIEVSQENGKEILSRDLTETRDLTYLIYGLKPATDYSVKLYAYNHKKAGKYAENTIEMEPARPVKPKKPYVNTDKNNIEQGFVVIERLSNEQERGSPIKNIIVESAKGEDVLEKWTRTKYNFTKGDRDIKLSVKLLNATDSKTMYFRVIMENSVGLSDPSDHCKLESYLMIPGEPHNIRVQQATNNSITLKWDEPRINPKSVDYYLVEIVDSKVADEIVWNSPSKITKQKLKQMSFTVSGLHPKSSYLFRILSYNKDNETLPINQVKIIPASTQPCAPKKPANHSVFLKILDPTMATISVTRPNIEESGSDVTAVYCEKCTENGDPIHYLTEMTSCEDVKGDMITQKIKIDNETHYLRVGLKNAVGLSELSEHICVSPSDIKPGPPQVDEVNPNHVTHNSLNLTWKRPKEQARAAKSYEVEISEQENKTQWKKAYYIHSVQSLSKNEAQIKCLVPVTKYYFRVFAYNGELKSLESNIVTITTIAARPEKPQTPAVYQLGNSPDKACLFVPRLNKRDENGSKVTKIKVEHSDETGSGWILCEEKELILESDAENISIEIKIPNIELHLVPERFNVHLRVKMINSKGESEPSEAFAIQCADLRPGSVQNLQDRETSEDSTTLTWEVPKIHPGIVKHYIIECKESDAEGWKRVVRTNANELSCKITDLQCYKEYKYNVIAFSNCRGPDEMITVITKDVIPLPPKTLKLDRTWRDALKIRWTKPVSGPEINNAYRVVFEGKLQQSDGTNSQESRVYYTRGHSKVLKNLVPNTNYTVEIAGVSKSKEISENVKESTFTTAMSEGRRIALTAAGSIMTVGIGGVAVYQYLSPDSEDHNIESDEEYDEKYGKEVEEGILPLPPKDFKLDKQWTNALKIRWSKPLIGPDINDAYRVLLEWNFNKNDGTISQGSKVYYTRGYSKVFKDLEPSTDYKVKIAGVHIRKSKKISKLSPETTFSTMASGFLFDYRLGDDVTAYESDEECDEEYKEVERAVDMISRVQSINCRSNLFYM